jgi:hypothetical protein
MEEPVADNVTTLQGAALKKVPDLNPPTARPPRAQRQEAAAPGGAPAEPKAPKQPKPPKEPKAPKAPTAPKAPRESRFAKVYGPNAVITLLVDKNPKRPGSASAPRFDLYATGMTVAQWRAKGGRWDDMSWDVGHGFISVDAPEGGTTTAEPAVTPTVAADTTAAVEEAEAKE